MPKTTTSELQELAENAIRVIRNELAPKATGYFDSKETAKFFKERNTIFVLLEQYELELSELFRRFYYHRNSFP